MTCCSTPPSIPCAASVGVMPSWKQNSLPPLCCTPIIDGSTTIRTCTSSCPVPGWMVSADGARSAADTCSMAKHWLGSSGHGSSRVSSALDGLELPPKCPPRWVVQCQHVGKGLPALKYLSRYLYRGVIAEKQIVAYDPNARTVTFRYQHNKTRQQRLRTLPLVEFLWRLMIHVLPSGYRRVRDFGFLHGNARRKRVIIQLALRVVIPPSPPRSALTFLCCACQQAMAVVQVLNAGPRPAT